MYRKPDKNRDYVSNDLVNYPYCLWSFSLSEAKGNASTLQVQGH